MLEGLSKRHLVELVKIFLSLVLSPSKLDAHQIEGFLVASSYVCDNLANELCERNALKELITGDKGKALLASASTTQAYSSLFNIISPTSPDGIARIFEECMHVVTNCNGLPKDIDCEAELRSAYKLIRNAVSHAFYIKLKVINIKQSFEDDYSVDVGIAWQIRDMLLHEDVEKSLLKSQSLEMSCLRISICIYWFFVLCVMQISSLFIL